MVRVAQINVGKQLPGFLTQPRAVAVGGGAVSVAVDDPTAYESWVDWVARLESYGVPGSLRWYVNSSRIRIPTIPSGSALAQRFRSTVGPDFGRAIELGAGIANTTTQLPITSPVAATALASVGFLGGLVLGLIPFEKIEAENRWRSLCSSMTPLERMATLVSIRPLVERAFAQDNIALPPGESFDWRYTDDVVHTLWSGRVASINGLVEILFASGEVVPPAFSADPRLRTWLLAYAFGYANGSTAIGQSYAILHSSTVESLKSGIPVADGLRLWQAFTVNEDGRTPRTVATLRKDAEKLGIDSIYNPMLPKAFRESVLS